MNKLFLYRLFRHSKTAFLFVALFIAFYAVSFYKKMDMVFFPYNGMYAVDFTKSTRSSTYAIKINGDPVRITKNFYWKKDLLETSLNAYCRYLKHGHKVFLNDYFAYKFSNAGLRAFLTRHLTAEEAAADRWPEWFIHTAGYSIPRNAEIEFMQYDLMITNNRAALLDSVSIYKTRIQ